MILLDSGREQDLRDAIRPPPRPMMRTLIPSMRRPVSFCGVEQRGEHDDGVPCWSSRKIGMSRGALQALLDLKAARGGDVLDVDPA